MTNPIKFKYFSSLLAAHLLCAALLLPGLAAAAEAGKFQFVIGDIKVISAAGAERVPVKGEAFNSGDTIVTGKSGSAQIRMSDGGMVAVRPDTQLKLDHYVFNGREDGSERKVVSLIKGGFRAITGLIGNRNKDNYKILTPSATIGIRGTDHEPVVVPPGAAGGFQAGTYDRVYRGATIIETDKGKLIVNPNQVGFTPGKGVSPVLLPKIPEFYDTKPARPDAGKETQGDSSRDDGNDDSKADAKSSSARSLSDVKGSATTLKSTEGKESAATLRSPLDASSLKDLGTTSTLKSDLLKGSDTSLTTPIDTRATSTLKDSTLKDSALTVPASSLKSDALSTPVTIPTTTLRSTEVLTTPVTSSATTLKTPAATTITTPITTTTKPLTTTVVPKTEAITVPTTTIRSTITTKP